METRARNISLAGARLLLTRLLDGDVQTAAQVIGSLMHVLRGRGRAWVQGPSRLPGWGARRWPRAHLHAATNAHAISHVMLGWGVAGGGAQPPSRRSPAGGCAARVPGPRLPAPARCLARFGSLGDIIHASRIAIVHARHADTCRCSSLCLLLLVLAPAAALRLQAPTLGAVLAPVRAAARLTAVPHRGASGAQAQAGCGAAARGGARAWRTRARLWGRRCERQGSS